jgi:hypothetical protein
MIKYAKWTYYILDPFDKGYNPAKAIERNSDMEILYFTEMAETLIHLTKREKKLKQINDLMANTPRQQQSFHEESAQYQHYK